MQNSAALDFFDAGNDPSGDGEHITLLRKLPLKPGGALVQEIFKQANALASVVLYVTEISERLSWRLLMDRFCAGKNGKP